MEGKARRLKHIPGAAGVDEAGRGPLAGPVVAAAVILPRRFNLDGINDSKQVSPQQREELALRIREKAIWAVASASVEEIDRLNILWASMEAMRRALEMLPELPEAIYIDGNRLPPGMTCTMTAVIDGDAKVACIAAASIIAKTERDRLMRELGALHPEYGFEKHFGYSTPLHIEALEKHGPCPHHRRSFERVRAREQLCLTFDA